MASSSSNGGFTQVFPLDVVFEVFSYLAAPQLHRSVCRHWHSILAREDAFRAAFLTNPHDGGGHSGLRIGNDPTIMQPGAMLASSGCSSWHELHQRTMLDSEWRALRPGGRCTPVDFLAVAITSLNNEEGAQSQVYYTYPRVVLHFRHRFNIFAIHTCEDVHRIVLKRGAHVRVPAVEEQAPFVGTGCATHRIEKLDFNTVYTAADVVEQLRKEPSRPVPWSLHPSPQHPCATTFVVAWTTDDIEFFALPYVQKDAHRFTSDERMEMARLRPTGPFRTCPLRTISNTILILHMNQDNIVAVLSVRPDDSHSATISFLRFDDGKLVHVTAVPGPIVPSLTIDDLVMAPRSNAWKSRERFDFKSSTEIGAIIDETGRVHVFRLATRSWVHVRCPPVPGDVFHVVRPKYVRTHANKVVWWTDREPCCAAYAIPDHSNEAELLLCKTYFAILSVYIDRTRLYVHTCRGRLTVSRDVMVDVWSLRRPPRGVDGSQDPPTGPDPAAVCRVNAQINLWSGDRTGIRTYLSKLFWSDSKSVMYYELIGDPDRARNVLHMRQVACIDTEEYLQVARAMSEGPLREEPMNRVVPIPEEYVDALCGCVLERPAHDALSEEGDDPLIV